MTTNSFSELCKEIWQRTKEPLKDPTFVMYFICAILICGGVGFWIEVLKITISSGTTGFGGIQSSLSVFYPALIGTSCLLLILESVERSNKLMASFFVLVIFLTFSIAILIGFFNLFELHPNYTFGGTIICSVLGLWVWCVANGENPQLKTINPDSPSGGDTNRPIKGDINEVTV